MIKNVISKIGTFGFSFAKNENERNNAVILNLTCLLGITIGVILTTLSIFQGEIFSSVILLIGTLLIGSGLILNSIGKFLITTILLSIVSVVIIPTHVWLQGNTGTYFYLLTGAVIVSFLSYEKPSIKNILITLTISSFFVSLLILKTKHNQLVLPENNVIFFNINVLISISTIAVAISSFGTIIKKQQQRLSELNLVKDKLLSVISHDLRGPLHNLMGLISIHENGDLNSEETKNYIATVNKEIKATAGLLDDVLIWIKGQMKGITPNKVRFNLKELAAKILVNNENRAKEKNIELEVKGNEVEVYADEEMVHLAIRNLVSNALKFANPTNGKVYIEIKRTNNYGVCSVIDNGGGLSKNDLKLFEAGTSFTKQGTQQEKGFGLGLLLTQEFLQHNNAILEATNRKGLGAEFIIKIPLS